MSYDLDQFISDCRPSSRATRTRAAGRTCALHLESSSQSGFRREYCGDQVPRGLKVLYEDPKLGFQVLAHINDKARGVAAA